MKRLGLRVISVCICVVLLLTIAQSNMLAANDNNRLSLGNLHGDLFLLDTDILDANKADGNISITRLNLEFCENKFEFSGVLNCEDDQIPLTTVGNFYPVLGGGYYDNKLILGDFATSGIYNFSHFRIEKECEPNLLLPSNATFINKTVVTVMIENISNGDLYYAQGMISDDTYDSILTFAQSSIAAKMNNEKLSKYDIDCITVGLLSIENKFVTRRKTSDTQETQRESLSTYTASPDISVNVDAETLMIQGVSVSYTELNKLFNDLKSSSSNSVNPNNYSTSIKNMLMQTGVQSYWGNSPNFFYDMKGVKNSSTEYLVQISMNAYVCAFVSGTNNQMYGKQEILHGMILSYDQYLNLYKVLYYNWGPTYKSVEIEIYGCSGSNVFQSRTVNGVVSSGGSTFQAFAALVPYLGSLVSAWTALSSQGTSALGQTYPFNGSTAAQQQQYYNGKVIYGMSGTIGNGYISLENQWMSVQGVTSLACGTMYFPHRATLTWNI